MSTPSHPLPQRALRRSVLLVPGHRQELLAKAAALPADVLLLDLQDSVPLDPAAKDTARRQVAAFARQGRHAALETSIRINGPRSPWVIDDVRAAVACGADTVTLPEAHGLRDVLFIEGLIEVLALEAGVPGPAILLEVETPGVLCELEAIASASRRVSGLCVAPYDYALETEAQVFGQPTTTAASDAHLAWLRPKVVAVARAHGWTATDAVAVTDTKDPAQVRDAIAGSRRLGFDGCAVLHPSQLPLVNEAFRLSPEELAWARETLAQQPAMRQRTQLASRLLARHAQVEQQEARRGAATADPDPTLPGASMTTDAEAIAFTDSVHADLKKAGSWLADIDFVDAIAAGTASREAFRHWGRQFFVAIEQLHKLAHNRPKLATIGLDDPEFKRFFWENRVEEQYGAISNTAGHLELLIQLLEALGVPRIETVGTRATPETKALLEWSRQHVLAPDEYLTTQVSIGLLESMNPDSALKMAQGAMQHYGLTDRDVRFFTVHITADAEHGEVAVRMLKLVPRERWEFIRQATLEQAGLMARLWNSALAASGAQAGTVGA